MQKELVSIIVPIYNVEKYLEECIESIISQTYKNIEIILVNDGSTDGSKKIVDEYASKYKFIKVIHKKNGGLSDARNCGIKNSNGEYICFVDSDDIVTNDYIETMYYNIKNYNTCIAACGMCNFYEDGKKQEICFKNIKQLYVGEDAHKYLNIMGYFNVSSCNKLYKKELFDNIEFPVGKKSEDWYIMYKLLDYAGSIYYSSDVKYLYRQRTGSITKSKKINYDAIFAAKEVIDYYKEKKYNNAMPYAYQSLACVYMGAYNVSVMQKNVEEMKHLYKEARSIRKKLTYKKISFIKKIQLFLFIHNASLYKIIYFDILKKATC